ncbi:MAG: ABC transporter substrate-binding protein [Chloroflexi bacterium]|nr:ABC transporter substrate-binding protein [Chloroflexota bacterium]
MKRVNVTAWLIVASILVGLAAACGGDDPTPTSAPATPTPTSGPAEVPAQPTPTPDPFAAEWQELIEAAQAEGQLVIALSGSDSLTGRFAFEAFEDQFDIEVVTSSGSGADNANRILAERSRGAYTVDLTTVSGGSMERLREAGVYVPVEPLLIHPEVLDRSTGWYFENVLWSDSESTYVMSDSLSVGAIGSIWYNTENVTEEELELIDDYHDLLRPEFKGRMAMRAMNNPGSKSVIARLWLAPGLGPDFLEALHRETDMDLVGAEADRELAEGVANGKWDFGLFGGGRDFRALQNLQLPVRELTLTKTIGALSTEISGGIGVVDQAPNPKAAQLFVNWWYSREGQTADVESTSSFGPLGAVSLRSDVTLGTFPDHLQETLQNVPKWRAEGTIDQFLVVYELNDEWFQVRESTEVFFNDLYKELGYDAWVNYNLP